MNVHWDKAGQAKVTLTKAEQSSLRKAQVLCERLAMNVPVNTPLGPEDGFTSEGIAATNLAALIERYCEPIETKADKQPATEGKATNAK